MNNRAESPTDREQEYGIQVTRNGNGVHIGTWQRGSLTGLTDDQARELLTKLQGVLAR